MNIAQALHKVKIKAPFFSKGGRASLHRYLDPDFVNRFRQDIQKKRFDLPQFEAWLKEEGHSQYDDNPVLRLPTHRAFHLVCCEVVCERFGLPALNPQRITSAGFVIRKVSNGKEHSWVLEEGDALGWQEASSELRDPDLDRRLCRNGLIHKKGDASAYSGEQTHPLHVLNTKDEKGKRHTLLFGFVPPGGFYYERQADKLFDKKSQQDVESFAERSLPWPFGYRNGKNIPWSDALSTPIDHGRPSKSIFELLRLLVNRYHVGEPSREANQDLEALCEDIWFYDEIQLPHILRTLEFNNTQKSAMVAHRKINLKQYLNGCFAQGADNPLVRWIIEQEDRIEAVNGLENLSSLDHLPNSNGHGNLSFSLKMLPSDAEDFRHHLGQRFHAQTLAQAKEIPLPKFSQGKHDLYQIVPFVRSTNDMGKEQIQWADSKNRSILFRVAAPFDPEASRPSLIPMPSLRDLKRGLAKGASFLTPGDTFDMINNLKLKKGVSADLVGSGPKLGIQWICSFSLPVITLVAMILLMIMISLLNIVFFWLPWVRICLPFPKIDK